MTQTADTKNELATFHGQHTDPMEITKRLEEAQRRYHLVSPSPAVAAIPDGCAVAMSTVLVDQAETYALPGSDKLGLGKAALDRIASAVGISWDPRSSGRLDDGRDPRYVHYRVVGRYRHFDGSMVTIQGEKIMDMRDGSPEFEGLQSRAKAKNRSADQQIREIRMHLLSHAETKARLRAIRSLGIRTGYTAQELQKPFVVAKLQLTGQFSDPKARDDYSKALTSSFLGASSALYPEATQPQALPHEPTPPVGAIDDRDADETIDQRTGEVTTSSGAAPAASPAPARPASSDMLVPKGKGYGDEGKPIAEASAATLDTMRNRLTDWQVSDPAKTAADEVKSTVKRLLAAVEIEIEWRAAQASGAPV